MKLVNLHYAKNKGWSVESFPELDSPNTLILVFAAPEYAQHLAPLQALKAAYPTSQLIGCSSAGEINDVIISDGSLSVAIIQFERSKVITTQAEISDSKDAYQAGMEISASLLRDDLQGIFILSDGLNVNGSRLVSGLRECNPNIPITGGLAGDQERFEKTWTITNDLQPRERQIVAVGFYGEAIEFGHGSKGGWDIFGPKRKITRSESNVVYEIDGQPALALYKKYLGERAAELPASALLFPLSIRHPNHKDQWIVRTVLSVDENEQSLTFAGDVPEGWDGQLMSANFDRLIDGATDAAIHAKRNFPELTSPSLSITVSCVGRRLILGERTEEEVEACFDVLPKDTQQVGFYSYGEIAPYLSSNCELHNETMTITVIRER